jgi:hypothetical protein
VFEAKSPAEALEKMPVENKENRMMIRKLVILITIKFVADFGQQPNQTAKTKVILAGDQQYFD